MKTLDTSELLVHALRRAAAERHRQAIMQGQSLDPETSLPHRHHYLCCICFLRARGVES